MKRPQPEFLSNRFSNIGISFASTERLRFNLWSKHQHRHTFACVICPRPSRVAPMVCGNKDNIVILKQRQNFRQSRIKIHQPFGISFNITTVSPCHIKVHKISKDNTIAFKIFNLFQSLITQFFQAAAEDRLASKGNPDRARQ